MYIYTHTIYIVKVYLHILFFITHIFNKYVGYFILVYTRSAALQKANKTHLATTTFLDFCGVKI